MTHYQLEQWTAYVRGTEIARTDMESHLANCDQCLEIYMAAVASLNTDLPVLPDRSKFVRQVEIQLNAIVSRQAATGPEARRPWFTQPIFHYAIAASITIVLVGSGAFQQLFERFSDLSRETEYGNTTAISEQLTDRAGQWLDTIPVKYTKKEGKP